MILVIKHVDIEGPETIGRFFEQNGFKLKEINLYDGDGFPKNLADIQAVICLGGPMNVYEEDKYPYLKEENSFIQRVLKEEVPYLGICLGSQLLSKAAQSNVVRSPKEEIGFFDAQLTKDGLADPIFKGIKNIFRVYHWHGDMFNIPAQGKLLAKGDGCPHQAFKVGPCAYGFQFHIEITDKSINEWSDEYILDQKMLADQKKKMLDEYKKIKKEFEQTADMIYENFLNIISQKKSFV